MKKIIVLLMLLLITACYQRPARPAIYDEIDNWRPKSVPPSHYGDPYTYNPWIGRYTPSQPSQPSMSYNPWIGTMQPTSVAPSSINPPQLAQSTQSAPLLIYMPPAPQSGTYIDLYTGRMTPYTIIPGPAPQSGTYIDLNSGRITPYTVVPSPTIGPYMGFQFQPNGRTSVTMEVAPGMFMNIE